MHRHMRRSQCGWSGFGRPLTAKTVLANNGPACTVEILRALTVKLTRARATARARARARALARTKDRPRLRAMVSSRARARAWECVYV